MELEKKMFWKRLNFFPCLRVGCILKSFLIVASILIFRDAIHHFVVSVDNGSFQRVSLSVRLGDTQIHGPCIIYDLESEFPFY